MATLEEAIRGSEEGLSKLLSALENINRETGELLGQLDQNLDGLETSNNEAQASLKKFNETLKTEEKELTDAHDNLEENLEGLEKKFQESATELEGLQEGMLKELGHWQNSVENAATQLEGVTNKLEADFGGFKDEIQKSRSDAETASKALEDMLDEGKSQVEKNAKELLDLGNKVTASVEGDMVNMRDEVRNNVDEVMGGFNDLLEGDRLDEVTSGLQNVHTQITDCFNDTDGAFKKIEEMFKAELEQSIRDILEHTKTEVIDRTTELGAEALEELVEIVLAEAIANGVMIGFGSTTTMAMAQVLPAIMAAKAAVEAVNAMAEMVGME